MVGVRESIPESVSEVGFARLALAHGSMWFGKRKYERVEDEEPLILGWPHGHLWYRTAAMLQLLKVDK